MTTVIELTKDMTNGMVKSANAAAMALIKKFDGTDEAEAIVSGGLTEVLVDAVYEASKDANMLPEDDRYYNPFDANAVEPPYVGSDRAWWDWRMYVEGTVIDYFRAKVNDDG